MKILLLADAWSSHTAKWANSLYQKGFDISLFSLSDYDKSQYSQGIKIDIIDFSKSVKKTRDGSLLKSAYLAALPKLKKLISDFNPHIVHAHSASSYGFLGALIRFHPYFISTWGSDVYIFPNKSIVHKHILKYSLSKADEIFSTSNAMKIAAAGFTSKEINVLNFGVDVDMFKSFEVTTPFNNKGIVIGTVKTLDYNYGIEYLLNAFSILVKRYPELPLRLLLVGGGGMIDLLRKKADALGISDITIFTGKVPFTKVPEYHNMMDIEVFPSVSESFGVSVLEASASGNPVVVSDAGGLPEVVVENITGLMFPSKDVKSLVEKLEILLLDEKLRHRLGKNGRELVEKHFTWNKSVDTMITFYNKFNPQ